MPLFQCTVTAISDLLTPVILSAPVPVTDKQYCLLLPNHKGTVDFSQPSFSLTLWYLTLLINSPFMVFIVQHMIFFSSLF